jgi:molecular chaperone IbpA|tara:strand:+ start:364 stop:807 length:444 start_codon:yes stop_codon:yes gene_type:complete
MLLDALLGPTFFRHAVGFEPYLSNIDDVLHRSKQNVSAFPPHDITEIRKGYFTITLALAGFGRDDLNVEVQGQKLTIEGSIEKSKDDISVVHTRGIAKRNFMKVFALGRHVEVENVILKNGLLVIYLRENIPDSKKPRQLSIINGDT